MSKTKLFSHTDLDGVGCAVLAKLAFGEDVDISYCNYDNIDEEVRKFYENDEDKYSWCFITDISISEELAAEIAWPIDSAEGYVLLDHHATALGLNKHDWCHVRVENEDGIKTSGTEMFYELLFGFGYLNHLSVYSIYKLDEFVKMVRDYDTWRWKELDGGIDCKRLNDLYYIYGREAFINLAVARIKSPAYKYFPSFDEADLALLENKQKEIDKYIEEKDKQLIRYFDQFGYICGVVFAERFFSELGNRLAELHPELHYIAMIDIADGKVSYRGVKDEIDLGSEIAHSYGGGGHKKAAGSTFDKGLIKLLVMDRLFNRKEYSNEPETEE